MFCEITTAIIGAVVGAGVGSLATYFLNKYYNSWKESQDRKIQIFRTLISTRCSGAYHGGRIKALNMIPTEFPANSKRWKPVVDAWRSFLDSLTPKAGETEEAKNAW